MTSTEFRHLMRCEPVRRTGLGQMGWEQRTDGKWYLYPPSLHGEAEALEFDTCEQAAAEAWLRCVQRTDDMTHGGPYDRGGADYWYGRGRCPHYYPEGAYRGERVTPPNMTRARVAEYHAGYDRAEAAGDQKDWR